MATKSSTFIRFGNEFAKIQKFYRGFDGYMRLIIKISDEIFTEKVSKLKT